MRKIIYILVLMVNSISGFSQELNNPTIKNTNIDFFNYNYKYLDQDYKISISSQKFDSIVTKYEFYKDRIHKYRDSLAVVLVENFNGDWKKTNKATFVISYSWQRLSYHLWMDIDDSKKLAKEFNFNHPYRFKQFLLTDLEDKEVELFFKNLKDKISNNIESTTDLDELSREQLLNFAMRYSKSRIKDFQTKSYLQEHGKAPSTDIKLGVSCGKSNCCQQKKI